MSIARAFVNRPLILLADEPTGNLDPATSVGIMRLLDRINRTGTTVVMATHDTSVVDTMRRRVIELDHGTIVRDQARRGSTPGTMASPARLRDPRVGHNLRRNLTLTSARSSHGRGVAVPRRVPPSSSATAWTTPPPGGRRDIEFMVFLNPDAGQDAERRHR